MELDKRIVEYANVIMGNAGVLLSEGHNLTEQQRHFVNRTSAAAERLISTNDLYLLEPLPTDDTAREELILVVVHDLRTPIALMIGYCDVLELFEDKSAWSENQIVFLKHIREHITMVEDVITDFSNE